MNPVLLLTRNNLELTKRCVESIRAQDIPTRILVVDNGSTDGTQEWLHEQHSASFEAIFLGENKGVSKGWNEGLWTLFTGAGEKVLVVNNDVELPPYFYRTLLSLDLPFVTGASVMERDHPCPERTQTYPGPDFSAFLISFECWTKIGPFDENIIHYCGDCDYHIRAHRLGVKLLNSGVPFYHERSSTLKNASPEDQQAISRQADRDRAAFWTKYGCYPWEPAYANLFIPQTVETE